MRSDARTVDVHRGPHEDRPWPRGEIEYGMSTYTRGEEVYAFASQKQYVSLYLRDAQVVRRYRNDLGKVNHGKNCARFRKLGDVDMDSVRRMIQEMATVGQQ